MSKDITGKAQNRCRDSRRTVGLKRGVVSRLIGNEVGRADCHEIIKYLKSQSKESGIYSMSTIDS